MWWIGGQPGPPARIVQEFLVATGDVYGGLAGQFDLLSGRSRYG
jgi:hypothetical protein